MDKILFENEFLAVVERDGYTFSREVRCRGIIVSVLPFRAKNSTLEFLTRLEVCPAHGSELERCSITGGLELDKTVEETVQQELWEEAGYQVELDELISLGQVRPSKNADTTAHLFAVDVSAKPESIPQGDASHFEANASTEWVDYEKGVQIEDPLFVTAMTRLLNSLKEEGKMELPGIKAKALTVGLPFGLGSLEFEANEVEQRAAWSLYVELVTRIAVQPLDVHEGLLREVLDSLYSLFGLTREILREAGPAVAHGPNSFGPVAIEVLNKGLRPFTSRWHPLLQAHEEKRPLDVSALEYERNWKHFQEMRQELVELQKQMKIYADVLAEISGAK